MKEKIGVVTDSGSMISKEEAEKLDVEVVPFWVLLGNEKFNDHQITPAELKQKVEKIAKFPSTSAPSPGEFIVAYEKKLDLGANQILSVHVARGIRPGTFESATGAAREVRQKYELAQDSIQVFDSAQVALALGFLVKEAVKLIAAGESFPKTLTSLTKMRSKLNTIGTFSDIRWAQKTAGMPDTLREFVQIIINNRIMPISPIIQIVEGDWKKRPLAIAKRRLAPRRIAELAVTSTPGKIEKAGIFHCDAPNQAAETAFYFERLTGTKPEIAEVPASFAAGAGPKAYGICLLGK